MQQFRVVTMDTVVKGSIIAIEAESYEEALCKICRMEGNPIEETAYLLANRDADLYVDQKDVDDVDLWQKARDYSNSLPFEGIVFQEDEESR